MRRGALFLVVIVLFVVAQTASAQGRLGTVLAPAEIPAGEDFCVRITASALEHGVERAIAVQYSDGFKFLGAYAADEDGADTVSLEWYPSVASMFTRERGHAVVAYEDHTTMYSNHFNAVAYFFRFRAPLKAATLKVQACLVERADLSVTPPKETSKKKQPKRRKPSASTTWKVVAPDLGEDFTFADADTKEYSRNIRIVTGWEKTSRALTLHGNHGATAMLETDSAVLPSLFAQEFTLSCWYRSTEPLQGIFHWVLNGAGRGAWLATDALGDLTFYSHEVHSSDDTIISVAVPITDGAWHYLTCTHDAFGIITIEVDGKERDTLTSSTDLSGLRRFDIGNASGVNRFYVDELSLRTGVEITNAAPTILVRDTVASLFGLFHFEDFGQTARSSVALRKVIHQNDSIVSLVRVPIYFQLDSGASIGESSSPVLTDHAVLSVEQANATKVTFSWLATSEIGVKRYELQRRIASFGDYEKTLDVKAKQSISAQEKDHAIVSRANYSAVETLPSIGRDIELSYRLALIGERDSVMGYTQPVKLEYGGNRDVFVEQNKPNPFNPKTIINFRLARACVVTVTVYDIMGREVGVLLNDKLAVGKHSLEVDATMWPGGIYFYKVKTPRTIVTKRMVVAK
ncbi:MAG: T9SS type A sorting domain-containing protein [Bacteroidetes bacterium]|nr:T9SS type A sorting domain-containing protein [Bacteroidota bacterium]